MAERTAPKQRGGPAAETAAQARKRAAEERLAAANAELPGEDPVEPKPVAADDPPTLALVPVDVLRIAHLYLNAVPPAILSQFVNYTAVGVEADMKLILPALANPAIVPPPAVNRAGRRARKTPVP